MAKVLLISDDNNQIELINLALSKNLLECVVVRKEDELFNAIKDFYPDLILLSSTFSTSDINFLAKKIKINTQSDNIIFSLIIPQDCENQDLLKMASSYITEPINIKILLSTIMSNIRVKKALDIMTKNNKDLTTSLYRLDVLSDTTSQFAGSLDKQKLIDVLLEGLFKSLNFNLSYTLLFNDDEVKLIINSLHPLSERFEDALKLRAMLSYEEIFDKSTLPYELLGEKIIIDKRIKEPFIEYDLPVLNYDSMFATITIGEKFFGVIEVFREEAFGDEDAAYFHSLSNQVSIPLETATVYEELKKTNVKLEHLERMKSEFISIVSHELRTPLTAIKNSLSIIKSGAAGEMTANTEKFIDLANRNTVRLSGIINDLLDLSKVEAGKMEFKFERMQIKTPIDTVKSNLENLVREKEIALSIEFEEGLPLLYIDSSRIEQVLTNLLSNAIKFTPEKGQIEINSSLKSGIELQREILISDKKYVAVSVKDSGIGIEEENLEKVFDKFSQIESSLSRKIGGTGLGLPIAKQLVEAHAGDIWVQSIPNQGSTFTFAIPVLSDYEIFLKDLQKEIQSAKTSNYQLGVVKIQDNSLENSLIEDISSNEITIVRKTLNVKEYVILENSKKTIYYVIMKWERPALNFIGKVIDGFVKKTPKYANCDIFFSTALFPEDTGESVNTEALITALNQNIEEIKA